LIVAHNERMTTITITITTATLEDAPAILSLQRLAYESEARLYQDWTIPALTQSLESLQQEFASHTILKAMRDGQLVGTVRAQLREQTVPLGAWPFTRAAKGRALAHACWPPSRATLWRHTPLYFSRAAKAKRICACTSATVTLLHIPKRCLPR
jgi:hypothetical protein